ncbi:hypothetical protein [Chitinophaga sancti]|uniref:Uncharacterized protein n=1 Tax=Chitinophaga sancti TaxID=1004 RepID=A0A1K1RHW2_9BACT|nr:hypothetical protein [Chitinophaga sancti]WQD60659.1 hypothetical protein U0033_22440 [Chitinophaga sancti]WQG87213.1 hypothetical protein SR876_20030 [Chitinophaga sancti]SFW71767.1 hypothetical protein SAMN05661012_03819 [Chitinophaga sancti]
MSSTKTPKAGKSTSKDARHDIEKKLDLLLVDLKKDLGDTKFKSRIKKAAKLLSKGVEKAKKKALNAKKKTKPAKAVKAKKATAVAATVAAE